MDYFGDESGHFRGLIQGDCKVCVIAVVEGDRIASGKCPKRTVRNISDVSEAKWNDLNPVQKRRLFECFAEQDNIRFGYARFTADMLHSLKNHYKLHQNVDFPPAWDLALAGCAYGELLFELDASDDYRPPNITVDRISSKPQTEKMMQFVDDYVDDATVYLKGSHQSEGVQAADCFAGAIAEDYKSDTNWQSYLDGDMVVEASYNSLLRLEHLLTDE